MDELLARVQRLEDELAVQRLVLSYGPTADAGLSGQTAARWTEDGVYDWDADGEPHEGRTAVAAMLAGDAHQGFVARGAAHVMSPPVVALDGDSAVAVNYSLVVARREEGFELWRTSAVRWDLLRTREGWRVARRTNRLLDGSGRGRDLFAAAAGHLVPGPTA